MNALRVRLIKMPKVILLFAAFILILVLGTTAVKADLGGSNVTFAPSTGGGAACYVPNENYQTLCLTADTYTQDGQDVETLFLKFPADWSVCPSAPTVVSASCTGDGSFTGAVNWTGLGHPGEWSLFHSRLQAAPGSCEATYCFQVDTGATTTSDASVSWSWYADTGGSPPIRPCSSDGYYGAYGEPSPAMRSPIPRRPYRSARMRR